jgi:hypothetical protein
MTWRKLTANRVAFTRFLCGMAERFAATGLFQDAIEIDGHRFTRTNFSVLSGDRNRAIHYCPCGQIALENNGGLVGLDDQGAKCDFASCRYFGRHDRQH